MARNRRATNPHRSPVAAGPQTLVPGHSKTTMLSTKDRTALLLPWPQAASEEEAMFKTIENLPDGAVGFEAHGRVTDADRRTILEPTIEWALETNGKVRLLYVAASDFVGYDRGGLYDDAVFGTRHFTDFDKIAFVSDEGPYDRAVKAMDGLMPAALRVFATADIGKAKDWLAA
jgi:hypothetical protein